MLTHERPVPQVIGDSILLSGRMTQELLQNATYLVKTPDMEQHFEKVRNFHPELHNIT
jgi:hypothetical protein